MGFCPPQPTVSRKNSHRKIIRLDLCDLAPDFGSGPSCLSLLLRYNTPSTFSSTRGMDHHHPAGRNLSGMGHRVSCLGNLSGNVQRFTKNKPLGSIRLHATRYDRWRCHRDNSSRDIFCLYKNISGQQKYYARNSDTNRKFLHAHHPENRKLVRDGNVRQRHPVHEYRLRRILDRNRYMEKYAQRLSL